jgi:hypothetical protein
VNLLRERVSDPLATWTDFGSWLDIYDDDRDKLRSWEEEDHSEEGPN